MLPADHHCKLFVPVAFRSRIDADRNQQANSASATAILGLLGVVLQDLNVPVGLNCSPISVVGVGGSDACSANAVCCEDNSHVRHRLAFNS